MAISDAVPEPSAEQIESSGRTLPSTAWLILLLGSLSAFGPLSLDTYLPALPELRADFGASASQAQLTLSACLLGLASGQVLAGPISDRFGRHRPLLFGLGLFAVASIICAVAPSIMLLIVARFVQGAAGGTGIVIARATVRDLHEGEAAARFFSRLMLVGGTAPILAPILGGQLLRFTDWRGVFVFLALVGGVLLIAAAMFLPETLKPELRRQGGLVQVLRTYVGLLRDRSYLAYAISLGFAGAALFAYIASSPFVLQDIHGLSQQEFSLVFGSIAVGFVLSSQVNARLVGRFPVATLLRFGLTVFAGAGLTLSIGTVLDWGLLGLLVPLYIMMAGIGFMLPNATALALSNYAGSAGSAAALLGLFQFAAGAIAAPIVGIRGEESAVPMGLVIGFATVSSFLMFMWLGRDR